MMNLHTNSSLRSEHRKYTYKKFTMKYFTYIVALATLFSGAIGSEIEGDKAVPLQEVCYEGYGCFSSSSPWTSLQRPLVALPKPPYEVGTRFLLYTRENLNEEYELLVDKEPVLIFSPFDAKRPTVFLIHGFTDSHKTSYMMETKNNLLAKDDLNVIFVDWAPGARAPYLQAVGNIRLVGAQTARLIEFIEDKGNMSISDVHVIGHSLGAHCAGYVGDRLMGRLPHITALDPTDPYFGGTDPIVRLDTADAKFVEVIHTNGNGALNLGLGIVDSIGHVDIYMNGGRQQPGCAISHWACSHARAGDLFAEAIMKKDSCRFTAYACGSYSDFQDGKCFSTCQNQGQCTAIGKLTEGRGNYYHDTANGEAEFGLCMQSVRVSAVVDFAQSKTVGDVTIQFRSVSGTKYDAIKIVDGDIRAGQYLNKWIQVPSGIMTSPDDKVPIILRYTRGGLLPGTQPRTLHLNDITLEVLNLENQLETHPYGNHVLENDMDFQINP